MNKIHKINGNVKMNRSVVNPAAAHTFDRFVRQLELTNFEIKKIHLKDLRMKTILITILIAFTVMPSNAQDKTNINKHLTFKGIPIDGTLNEFVLKLEKKGFTVTNKEDGVVILEGDFAGYKDCNLGVSTLEGEDLVNRISVVFPENNTWSGLSSDYFTLKELLTEKYGKPAKIVEEFQTSSVPKDDSEKMLAVGMNSCKYYSTYELKNGIIQLSIERGGFSDGYVMLSYFDKINTNIIKEKAKADL